MTPASVTRMPVKHGSSGRPRQHSDVNVLLSPTQLTVVLESLRMARIEVMKAAVTVRGIWPDSITHAEQLASYAELMADTLAYLGEVNV